MWPGGAPSYAPPPSTRPLPADRPNSPAQVPMRSLRLAVVSTLVSAVALCSTAAFAGNLNKELSKSQTGMKKFFTPVEKKLHDAGPEGQKAANTAQKVDPKATKQVQQAA